MGVGARGNRAPPRAETRGIAALSSAQTLFETHSTRGQLERSAKGIAASRFGQGVSVLGRSIRLLQEARLGQAFTSAHDRPDIQGYHALPPDETAPAQLKRIRAYPAVSRPLALRWHCYESVPANRKRGSRGPRGCNW